MIPQLEKANLKESDFNVVFKLMSDFLELGILASCSIICGRTQKKNPYETLPKKINRLGVLGAGFMGAGITEISITNNVDVILKDLDEKTISNAKSSIWKTLNKKVKRKQIQAVEAKEILQKTIGQTNFSGFNKLEMVIEAVVENMDIKKKGAD